MLISPKSGLGKVELQSLLTRIKPERDLFFFVLPLLGWCIQNNKATPV